MEAVQSLIKKKDNIEEQIKAYYDVLEDVSWYVYIVDQLSLASSN